MMYKKILFLLSIIITIAVSGCEKVSPLCGGNNPVDELPWLKQEIRRLENLGSCISISRSTYNKQTVYIFSNCETNVDNIPFLYDCAGNKVDLLPGDYEELKFTGDIELIWKSN